MFSKASKAVAKASANSEEETNHQSGKKYLLSMANEVSVCQVWQVKKVPAKYGKYIKYLPNMVSMLVLLVCPAGGGAWRGLAAIQYSTTPVPSRVWHGVPVGPTEVDSSGGGGGGEGGDAVAVRFAADSSLVRCLLPPAPEVERER